MDHTSSPPHPPPASDLCQHNSMVAEYLARIEEGRRYMREAKGKEMTPKEEQHYYACLSTLMEDTLLFQWTIRCREMAMKSRIITLSFPQAVVEPYNNTYAPQSIYHVDRIIDPEPGMANMRIKSARCLAAEKRTAKLQLRDTARAQVETKRQRQAKVSRANTIRKGGRKR